MRILFWENVIVVVDGKKRPGVIRLLEDEESGEPQIKISGRGTWFSAGDPEITTEIFLTDIEKIVYNPNSITILLTNKHYHRIDLTFKNYHIRKKCADLLRQKFYRPDAILTEVGKEAAKLFISNPSLQIAFPRNLWELKYHADEKSLSFSILVDYDLALREFTPYLMDPISWVGVIAFFTGYSLKAYHDRLPDDVRVGFTVNQPDMSAKMLVFSSSVPELLHATEEVASKPIKDIVTRMAAAMDME